MNIDRFPLLRPLLRIIIVIIITGQMTQTADADTGSTPAPTTPGLTATNPPPRRSASPMSAWAPAPAVAAEAPPNVSKPPLVDASMLPKYTPGQRYLKLGRMEVDTVDKTIRLPVTWSIADGILEYLLVTDKGKTYESVFRVADLQPSELHFALLLIGCEPCPFPEFEKWMQHKPPAGAPDPLPGPASAEVELIFRRQGQPVRWEEMVASRESPAAPAARWLFTGSFFTPDGKYAANLNLSVMAIWPDNSALIHLASRDGNPYRGLLGWEINRDFSHRQPGQEFEICLRPLRPTSNPAP